MASKTKTRMLAGAPEAEDAESSRGVRRASAAAPESTEPSFRKSRRLKDGMLPSSKHRKDHNQQQRKHAQRCEHVGEYGETISRCFDEHAQHADASTRIDQEGNACHGEQHGP